jgi:hypothetical protein
MESLGNFFISSAFGVFMTVAMAGQLILPVVIVASIVGVLALEAVDFFLQRREERRSGK